MMKSNSSITLRGICRFLKKNDDYCILTHASPDGDTLGSAAALAIALKNNGKRCFILCPDKIPEKYSYFLEKEFLRKTEYKKIIAVDVASQGLLGNLSDDIKNNVDLCIDHHISNTKYAKKYYVDADSSANCEIIYEIIKMLKWEITDKMAAALYTGITTDTGSFKYSNVTAKTHKIAAELYNYDIKASDIAKLMFDTKSKGLLTLETMILQKAQFFFDDRCFVLTVTTDMMNKTNCSDDELESIAPMSRCVEGVIAGVTIKQKNEDTFKVSLRTYEPLDASQICKSFGGGGHRFAAGCTVKGSLDEVKEKVLAAIQNALEVSDAGTSAD